MTEVTIYYKWQVTVEFDLETAEKYLTFHKWKETDKYGEFGRIFSKGKHKLLLPSTDKIGDFGARISEFVTDLAIIEHKEPWKIARQMQKLELQKHED